MIPTIRPNVAPTAMEGTKIPAGTLHPYEITTSPVRIIVAMNNELATDHCTDVLHCVGYDCLQAQQLHTYWHKWS